MYEYDYFLPEVGRLPHPLKNTPCLIAAKVNHRYSKFANAATQKFLDDKSLRFESFRRSYELKVGIECVWTYCPGSEKGVCSRNDGGASQKAWISFR